MPARPARAAAAAEMHVLQLRSLTDTGFLAIEKLVKTESARRYVNRAIVRNADALETFAARLKEAHEDGATPIAFFGVVSAFDAPQSESGYMHGYFRMSDSGNVIEVFADRVDVVSLPFVGYAARHYGCAPPIALPLPVLKVTVSGTRATLDACCAGFMLGHGPYSEGPHVLAAIRRFVSVGAVEFACAVTTDERTRASWVGA